MKLFKNYKFLLLIALFAGCRKTEMGFEMPYRREFTLPIGLNIFQSHNFEFKDIASDTVVFFQAHSVSAKDIMRIEPSTMYMRAIFGGADNGLLFIDRVEVWISDPSRPTLTSQIVFFRDDIPLTTGNRLDLVPNNVDVRPFLIDGNRFNLRINLRLRNTPDRSIDMEWNGAFFAFTNK